MKRMSEAFISVYNEGRKLYVKCEYERAIPYFEEALESGFLDSKHRLMAIGNLIVSNHEVATGRAEVEARSYIESFHKYVDLYPEALSKTPPDEIAPPPVLDILRRAIMLWIRSKSTDDFVSQTRHLLARLLTCSQERVGEDDLYKTCLTALDDIRRDVNHPTRGNYVRALGQSLLLDLKGKPYPGIRAAINVILADTQYFLPEGKLRREENLEAVSKFLSAALVDAPDDPFASTFDRNLRELRFANLQIRGFLHDARKRVARIKIALGELEEVWPIEKSKPVAFIELENELEELFSVAELVSLDRDRVGEPPASEARNEDIAGVIGRAVVQHRWPGDGIERVGKVNEWFMWPGFVLLALSNLIANTLEAYSRRKSEMPSTPARFLIDYNKQLVTYRDWAGGIESGIGDIFAPYVSVNGVHSGRGLGLPRARAAMRAQGFDLRLSDSQPDDGAEFIMDFNTKE